MDSDFGIRPDHGRSTQHILDMFVPGFADIWDDRIPELLESLPRLTEAELKAVGQIDGTCPICLIPFLALLVEEEAALAMESPAHPIEELGVTKLSKEWQCGHIFCRKDLTKWVKERKHSCPLCRKSLLDPLAQGEAQGLAALDEEALPARFGLRTRSSAAQRARPSEMSGMFS